MLVHPQFDPIAFQIGPVAVRWYGLMYVVGFVLFVVLGKYPRAAEHADRLAIRSDVDDMLLYGVFGVILGGRLGYVLFYKPLYYLAHPLEILRGLAGRDELPRRLDRRARRAVVLRAQRAASAGSPSPISSRR